VEKVPGIKEGGKFQAIMDKMGTFFERTKLESRPKDTSARDLVRGLSGSKAEQHKRNLAKKAKAEAVQEARNVKGRAQGKAAARWIFKAIDKFLAKPVKTTKTTKKTELPPITPLGLAFSRKGREGEIEWQRRMAVAKANLRAASAEAAKLKGGAAAKSLFAWLEEKGVVPGLPSEKTTLEQILLLDDIPFVELINKIRARYKSFSEMPESLLLLHDAMMADLETRPFGKEIKSKQQLEMNLE